MKPADFEAQQFTVVRLREGYAMSEVDDFLDRTSDAFARLTRANEDLELSLAAARKVGGETQLGNVSRLLAVAQRTADEQVAEAHHRAGEIEVKATADAQAVIAQAHAEANRIIEGATGERHRVLGEMEERRAALETRVNELATTEADTLARLKEVLERWNG